MQEVEADLISQGMNPIWKWKESNSLSPDLPRNNGTPQHYVYRDELNTNRYTQLPFYLSHLGVLRDIQHAFLIDDDVLVQRDLAKVVTKPFNQSTGLTCACGGWEYSDACWRYDFNLQQNWRFGLCLFQTKHWRTLDLTRRYEEGTQSNYSVALAGSVGCWEEDTLKVRSGFGLITREEWQQAFGETHVIFYRLCVRCVLLTSRHFLCIRKCFRKVI